METKNTLASLSINGLRFVRNASLLVDSLFNPGGTAAGLFNVRKHSVLFMRPNGEPFACLIANPGQTQFFVSCGMAPQANGKPALYYSYGLTDEGKRLLGLSGLTYSQESDEAANAWAVANS